MTAQHLPSGLGVGGKALWSGVTAEHPDLDAGQRSTLELACRQRDRADQMAGLAAQGDFGALRHERDCALAATRLVVAMRLPDATGRQPQARQLRGVQLPGGRVSSLDRARQAKSG